VSSYYSGVLCPQTEATRELLQRDFIEEHADFTLGPWEIDFGDVILGRILGEGAFGEVFIAHYSGQQVAAKVLKSTDFPLLRSFVREVSALQRTAECEHIVQLKGACSSPVFCILTELMEGSLHNLLHKQLVQLTLAEILQVTQSILHALCFLNSLEPPVIHRDVTSENILYSGGMWKLADFGVARTIEATDVEKVMSPTGNPRWRAPEVARGLPYSTKADIFSLGVVLWECLTNSVPFANLPEREGNHVVNVLHLPDLTEERCPKDLKRLVERCLQPKPEDRPDLDVLCAAMAQIERRALGRTN